MNDLTGMKINRWKIISRAGSNKHNQATWHCICDCGTKRIVIGSSIINNLSLSCGCLMRERAAEANKTHGLSKSSLATVWSNMKSRCHNKKALNYSDYGGRGITVCDEWINNSKAFYKWALEHGYNDRLFIDRKDNNKGYSPDNCRFVSRTINNNNKRKYRTNTTGFRGVSTYRNNGLFRMKIQFDKVSIVKYGFRSALEASLYRKSIIMKKGYQTI